MLEQLLGRGHVLERVGDRVAEHRHADRLARRSGRRSARQELRARRAPKLGIRATASANPRPNPRCAGISRNARSMTIAVHRSVTYPQTVGGGRRGAVSTAVVSDWRDDDGFQHQDQGERAHARRDREPRYPSPVRLAQRAPPAWPAVRLRSCAVWCLLGAAGRQGDPLVRHPGGGSEREEHHDAWKGCRRCGRRSAGRRLLLRRCIRCSRRGSTCRCRIAAIARTG